MNNIISKDYLSSKNIKPSFARIKIFEYLSNNHIHPTIDEIYHALIDEIPTLSKTTVYNTMKIFIDNKLVKLVSIEDTETRYDINVQIHGHFKCESCGKIYDFNVDLHNLLTDDLNGYNIHEKNIYFKGICNTCSNNSNTN
ncbi:transcriptional repressor [Alkalibaculum sp. M08DMB]|uniref:Transcriptional repressor n=1 Tax=Alkalibaculum sporogenes TaxID=2655001 RepID=A0A6A7KBR0_9FIRM|nr:transcriptional repressor [Alkalibaculum sporogenes]